MMVFLALVAGIVLLVMVWRGTRGQPATVKIGAVGAIVVLAGSLVIGSLMMATDPGENLVITEAALSRSETGARKIAGTVENRTDRRMAPVRLEFDLFDSESRIVERSMLDVGALEARDRRDFLLPVESEKVAGFRVRAGSPDNVRPAWLGGGCGSEVCRKE